MMPAPNLRYFLSSYFHQDWKVEGARSWINVLVKFVESERPATAADVISEIEQLTSDGFSEVKGTEFLQQVGCYFVPNIIDMSVQAWLLSIAEELRRLVREAG